MSIDHQPLPDSSSPSSLKRPTSATALATEARQPATKKQAIDTTDAMTFAESSASGSVPLMIKRLSEDARLPTRGSAFAAGYDLYR